MYFPPKCGRCGLERINFQQRDFPASGKNRLWICDQVSVRRHLASSPNNTEDLAMNTRTSLCSGKAMERNALNDECELTSD